jgi:DNA-directed RNA polymerase subunit RPC12/RpoP
LSDESDRVVVRKDKLARCKWCGSPESNNWVTSQQGDIYCTAECMEAATMERKKAIATAYIICSLAVIVLPFLFVGSIGLPVLGPFVELMFYAFCMVICGIALYFTANEGKKYQDRKGKYSGTPPIECEYCKHPNPPSATRCLNCDASLAEAPFVSEAIPPWISKQKKVKGVKCPMCGAIYSYSPEQISDDGIVLCQNCNRQFTITVNSVVSEVNDRYRY